MCHLRAHRHSFRTISDAYLAYEEGRTNYELLFSIETAVVAKLGERGEVWSCRTATQFGQLMPPAAWPANENVFLSGPQLAYNIG